MPALQRLSGPGNLPVPGVADLIPECRGIVDPWPRDMHLACCTLKHGIVVNDGDCIVDVGTRSGLFSLHVSRLANRLRMFAFGPHLPLYRLPQVHRALLAANMRRHVAVRMPDSCQMLEVVVASVV